MKISPSLVIATIFLLNSAAFAGTPGLDKRQENQSKRISQGVISGELTRKESRRLIKGQTQLQKMEYRAKKDGIVTKRERVRLQNKADIESAKIAKNKHDKQKRF